MISMRLFASIELPKHIKDELVRIQKHLGTNLFQGKLIPPENFHITLAFFGSVDTKETALISTQLATISYPVFKIHLQAVELNKPSNPHVLWITLDAPLLAPLAQLIFEKLPDYKEERSFHGHITIARIKKVINKQKFNDIIATTSVQPLTWEVRAFELRESETVPGGPVYTTIGTYALLA